MKLPAANRVIVEPRKIREYLLSRAHPVGRFKAHFFEALGFTPERWEELDRALKQIAATYDVEISQPTAFGRKYKVCGRLVGTKGAAKVATIWIVLHGESVARLVTAYPESS